jgi:hypothetical protein
VACAALWAFREIWSADAAANAGGLLVGVTNLSPARRDSLFFVTESGWASTEGCSVTRNAMPTATNNSAKIAARPRFRTTTSVKVKERDLRQTTGSGFGKAVVGMVVTGSGRIPSFARVSDVWRSSSAPAGFA